MNINKHVTTVPQEDYEEMMKAVSQPNVLANASSLFFAFMVEREANRQQTFLASTPDLDKRKLLATMVEDFKSFCTRAGWSITLDVQGGMIIITNLKQTQV